MKIATVLEIIPMVSQETIKTMVSGAAIVVDTRMVVIEEISQTMVSEAAIGVDTLIVVTEEVSQVMVSEAVTKAEEVTEAEAAQTKTSSITESHKSPMATVFREMIKVKETND